MNGVSNAHACHTDRPRDPEQPEAQRERSAANRYSSFFAHLPFSSNSRALSSILATECDGPHALSSNLRPHCEQIAFLSNFFFPKCFLDPCQPYLQPKVRIWLSKSHYELK
jgi:hypothetical protein